MSEYRPDNWVIVQIKGDDPHYRVLGGWSGGYTTGDSWRMNSGIVRVDEDEDHYYFFGSSGSCYNCSKDSNTMRMNIAPTFNSLKNIHGDKISLVGTDVDYMDIDWVITS